MVESAGLALRSTRRLAGLEQRSPKDQGSDGEIDHQSRDVDQGRDERCRSAGRIEPGPLQDEWEMDPVSEPNMTMPTELAVRPILAAPSSRGCLEYLTRGDEPYR